MAGVRQWRSALVVAVLVAGQLLVVGVGPAGAGAAVIPVSVATEMQYRNALGTACGATDTLVIDLTADITLMSNVDPAFAGPCDLTINGNGHILDGNDNSRSVVNVTADLDLGVFDLVAVDGNTGSDGGAINQAGGGSLEVDASWFDSNAAGSNGGGVNFFGGSSGTVTNSTFTDNSAGNGGGLSAIEAIVANSTFYGNTATSFSGAIDGPSNEVVFSTIAHNSQGSGGQIGTGPSAFNLFGVTLSDPQGASANNCEQPEDVGASTYSQSTDSSCDLESLPDSNVDDAQSPQLGALTNGWWGPPSAMVPAAASPLVNAIPPTTSPCGDAGVTDARGVVRPSGSGCDIGAVERDVVAPMVAVAGVMDGAVYSSGEVPGAFCTQTDPGGSGIATPASVEVTGPASGIGTFTATCSGAVDREGNAAGPVSVMYTVVFNPDSAWYGMVETDGTVYTFPPDKHQGNAVLAAGLGETAVDFVINNDGTGYYVLTSFGRVLPFGPGSTNHGNLDLAVLLPGETVEAMALTESGNGYWIFTSRGRAVTFGDAPDIGDVSSLNLNAPVVDAAPYPPGFYMAAGDGGVFTPPEFVGSQQVPFYGSMGGVPLNEPVVTIYVDASDDDGYTLAAADGGMFNFRSKFCNSVPGILAPGTSLNQPVVNAVPWGTCYLVFAADGGAFNFSVGELPFLGSLGDNPPDTPIVSGDAYFM